MALIYHLFKTFTHECFKQHNFLISYLLFSIFLLDIMNIASQINLPAVSCLRILNFDFGEIFWKMEFNSTKGPFTYNVITRGGVVNDNG